ncbi:MAG: UDP-N-acetylmuramoyl-L-alanine--D-glutamate ligase [Patescibacteria group bacterium]|nr:UDP-N-acetylmuramoyl-L-alanine--D-glutamate ligase [Patescibacteria group bacterium]
MKIAIAGFDTEGRSSYEYFLALGHELTILDQNEELVAPTGADTVLGAHYLDALDRFDLIVRTAGLPPHVIFEPNPQLDPAKVTTQINEFFKACPTSNTIGVTGTKGKGTTSTLITQMLRAARLDVQLAGNIGVPALDILPTLTPESWVVLELSSFQLIDLKASPNVAVCLMVVPEHLNWHADMAEYVAAKSQLFMHQTASDLAIYFAENETSRAIASHGDGQKLSYYSPPGAVVIDGSITIDGQIICKTDELKLLGAHNWQNACAAITAVWQITQNVEALRSVLTSFSGLEHRLELVRTFNDVLYYDDSFGTTPETAIVAMEAFEQPKIVILGGSDKGASYDDLAAAVAANNVRQVLLIGDQAAAIQTSLEAVGYSQFMPGGATMPAIVTAARELAQAGDVVLLSTGCASFGMFQNYKDRGAQFKTAVQALV